MTKTPSWTVGIVLALVAVAIVFQSATEASYWRGVADDAAQRLETQQLVVDSIKTVTDSLSLELQLADSIIIEQRALAELEVTRLTNARQLAELRSEQLSESLRASLDSAQAVQLDAVVESYEEQIDALESMLEVERELTASESLRATQASALVVTLESGVVQ